MIEVMTTDQIRVRRREVVKPGSRKFYLAFAVPVVVMLAVAGFLIAGNYFGGFERENVETVVEGGRRIIKVPAGGNLQSAINRATGGDIIVLEAGATYNEIVLPKKNINDFITIQSSAIDQLPADARVSPQQARLMAKITTRGGGKSAVATDNGAHHFRFAGIEFVPTAKDYVYNLIYLGASSNLVSDVPHDLEFDRCLVRSTPNNVTRRGIGLNSANTVIKNSYFEGFAYPQEETQAICGWTGTKNVKIFNNYIEGGAENVMFGGSDPASAELIPQDIEVRGNHFNKPEAWRGKNSMKCLFEIKNAKRLQFTDNYLENNWLGAAFRITVRNDGGTAAFSTIEDVVIKNNVVNGAGEGINILGKDDMYPSQTLKRLSIVNNLFLNIGEQTYEGGGYFVQVSNGVDILIANNTSFNRGNITTFHGDLPQNFAFRDNIVGHGNYGIHGFPNIKSADAQRIFRNNAIVNNRGIDAGDTSFPSGNFWVSDIRNVGLVNLAQKNYALNPSSKFKGKGTNRSDLGCDVSQMPALRR